MLYLLVNLKLCAKWMHLMQTVSCLISRKYFVNYV